jgi:hypothetical protein
MRELVDVMYAASYSFTVALNSRTSHPQWRSIIASYLNLCAGFVLLL